MYVEFVQGVVEVMQQALFADVFDGDFQEVEDAFVQVQLGGGRDAVQGQVTDGLGLVMQRIEDQEAFLFHQVGGQEPGGGEADHAVIIPGKL